MVRSRICRSVPLITQIQIRLRIHIFIYSSVAFQDAKKANKIWIFCLLFILWYSDIIYLEIKFLLNFLALRLKDPEQDPYPDPIRNRVGPKKSATSDPEHWKIIVILLQSCGIIWWTVRKEGEQAEEEHCDPYTQCHLQVCTVRFIPTRSLRSIFILNRSWIHERQRTISLRFLGITLRFIFLQTHPTSSVLLHLSYCTL